MINRLRRCWSDSVQDNHGRYAPVGLYQGTRELAADPGLPLYQLPPGFGLALPLVHISRPRQRGDQVDTMGFPEEDVHGQNAQRGACSVSDFFRECSSSTALNVKTIGHATVSLGGGVGCCPNLLNSPDRRADINDRSPIASGRGQALTAAKRRGPQVPAYTDNSRDATDLSRRAHVQRAPLPSANLAQLARSPSAYSACFEAPKFLAH